MLLNFPRVVVSRPASYMLVQYARSCLLFEVFGTSLCSADRFAPKGGGGGATGGPVALWCVVCCFPWSKDGHSARCGRSRRFVLALCVRAASICKAENVVFLFFFAALLWFVLCHRRGAAHHV